jgi:deoxycytidylate deaminase
MFNKFYPMFCHEALNSNISNKLAAGILKGKKLVSKVCCNINRNLCRGVVCGSLHAEANALLTYFGKSLQFNVLKNKWCLQPINYKKCKKT